MRAAACIILILLAGCTDKPEYTEAPVAGDEVVIDIARMPEKVPAFFSLRLEGKRYDFFVQVIKGKARAYADACHKCGPRKKGFSVEGRRLHCNACGESFPLDALEGIGSCYPIPISGEQRGDTFVLKVEDIVRKISHPI